LSAQEVEEEQETSRLPQSKLSREPATQGSIAEVIDSPWCRPVPMQQEKLKMVYEWLLHEEKRISNTSGPVVGI
jgi:hypothetical protein